MRLIDADKLEANMYHETFETDTDMQKWESGCWIRYKMFENQIAKMPVVKAIPVEWLKKKVKEALDERRIDDALYLKECLEEWEKGNEIG